VTAFADAAIALWWVQTLVCVGAAVGALELLARPPHWRPSTTSSARSWPGGLRVLLVLRLALALLLAAHACPVAAEALALLALIVVTQAVHLRLRYGTEGADQMTAIVIGALALRALAPYDPVVARGALWFIALQGSIAYLTAGVAKAHIPGWRDGSHVAGLLRTRSYGHPWLAARLGSPRTARMLSWLLIVWESTFPLALVHPVLAGAYCAIGVLFHAANALLLGLNLFVWAFLATYPAVLSCASDVVRG
jgi:hypothetical protein